MIREQHRVRCAYFSTRNLVTRCARRFVRSIPAKVYGFVLLLAALAAIESLPGFMAFAEQPAAPAVNQSHDSDKPARTRSKVINNSDQGVTITFSSCRENEKHHVSCQFTDPSGEQHWVYLAGVSLPASK